MMSKEDPDVMLAEIKSQPEILRETIEKNRAVLEVIGRELAPRIAGGDLDNVVIIARGSSDNAANLGKYLLETKTGLPVSLAAPSVVNLYNAPLKLSRSLVIGVSQSGKTNEVIEFMERSKSGAGYSIGITNVPDSDLTKMNLNAVLLCHAGVEKAVAATKSFSSTMMIFYLLALALSQNQTLMEDLKGAPELMRRTLAIEADIIRASKWLGAKDECFILARGYNYPIALEAGLKLQESAYVRAKAYSGADFQHGPLAIIQEGVSFLVFEPEGPSYEGINWLANEVAVKGGDLLVFSSKTGEANNDPNRFIIKVPQADEWLSPFVFTVVGQLLAYHTAKTRGINPNNPRWLHKVTLTK